MEGQAPTPAPEGQSTPAPAPEGQTPAPAPEGQTPAPDANNWLNTLSEETKGFAELKGFKDASTVVDSYRNLEKLMGAPKERLVKLPEKMDDKDGWGEVYNKLGRPEKPEGYNIEGTKERPVNEDFAKWARESFHELGLTKSQGETLVNKWGEYSGSLTEAAQKEAATKLANDNINLKQEWGAAFEQNIEIGKRAATAFGIDGDTIDQIEKTMGFSGTMKFFHQIGSKLSEDNYIGGDAVGNGVLSPAGAKEKIKALSNDKEWSARFLAGGAAEKAEMEQLHKWSLALK